MHDPLQYSKIFMLCYYSLGYTLGKHGPPARPTSFLFIAMTIQDLDSLLNLIKADADLRKKLSDCATPEAAQEVVSSAGYTLSIEEMLSMRSNLGAINLSDAELEGVAGGGKTNSDTCVNRGCPGG